MRERLVSVIGGRADNYVTLEKPSNIIPFKGDFPILKIWDRKEYNEVMGSTKWLEDLPLKFQKIVIQGNAIALYEQGFKKFLKENRIEVDDFLKLDKEKKADWFLKWLNKDCLEITILNIK